MLLRFLAVFAALFSTSLSAGADSPPYPLVLPGTAFDSMHAKAVAANQPGVSFTLRTVHGHTRFRCGERIQVQFVLSSRLKNTYQCDPGVDIRDGWNTDVFVCDATTGAVDPYTSDYLLGHNTLVGDQMQAINPLNKPHIDTMDLNEWIAFDKPGTYRVYAITHRVYPQHSSGQAPNDTELNGGPPTASTALTLTITPTDKDCEQKVISEALASYHGPWDDVMEQRGALLRYLRTKDAAVALVHELENSHTYQYEDDKSWYEGECSEYLMESPYRDEIIPVMEHDIADPDIAITSTFLQTYYGLLIYKSAPTKADDKGPNQPSPGDLARHALALLQQALPAKRGAALAVSSQTAKTFDKSGMVYLIAWMQGG